MARKRLIAPEFFTSKTVNDLSSSDVRLTFIGLWCYADDDGRAEDDADLIKAAVWPRQRRIGGSKIRAHLQELHDHGLICRYTVNGHPLLHLPSWREHQKPSHPTPSRIAPCEIHEPDEWHDFLNDDDHRREKYRDIAGVIRESFAKASRETPTQVGLG